MASSTGSILCADRTYNCRLGSEQVRHLGVFKLCGSVAALPRHLLRPPLLQLQTVCKLCLQAAYGCRRLGHVATMRTLQISPLPQCGHLCCQQPGLARLQVLRFLHTADRYHRCTIRLAM